MISYPALLIAGGILVLCIYFAWRLITAGKRNKANKKEVESTY